MICMAMLGGGFIVVKLITVSEPVRIRKEIGRLQDRNTELLEIVVSSRETARDLSPDMAAKVTAYREELNNIRELRRQYRKEDRPMKERRALMRGYHQTNREFKQLKMQILTSTLSAGGTAKAVKSTMEYHRNQSRVAELKERPGFFYSEPGYLTLLGIGLVFQIVMLLGLMGTVFFGIVNGLNLMFSLKYRDA